MGHARGVLKQWNQFCEGPVVYYGIAWRKGSITVANTLQTRAFQIRRYPIEKRFMP
jgi:hypothetical protein